MTEDLFLEALRPPLSQEECHFRGMSVLLNSLG
jgi:hypothetical protein